MIGHGPPGLSIPQSPFLLGCDDIGLGLQLALGEVYFLVTSFAGMPLVEFIGKDFHLFSAVGTLADKGF
jgi:hypothetical protein